MTLACLGLYFNQLNSWSFIDPGETYYTEAAREMVESGEWIVPHLNYQIYFSKPILTFWLTAWGYRLFGLNEMAARLPFALLSSLLVFAAYYTIRVVSNKKAALIAGLATASAPLLMLISKTSCIDAAFTTFLNLAVFATILALFARRPVFAPVIYLSLALAVLTKGPAGLILFAMGTVVFAFLQKPKLKEIGYWIIDSRPIVGIPLFLMTVLPWYYLVTKATKGLFLQVFLLYENLARFAGKTNYHKGSPLYYLPVLAYGLAPWFLLLPQALKQNWFHPLWDKWFSGKLIFGFKTSYRPHARKMLNPEGSGERPQLSPEELEEKSLFYLATWALSTMAFFSLSKTQLDTYLLPAIAPFACCLAVTMTRLCQPPPQQGEDSLRFDRLWLLIVLGIVATFTLLAGVALVVLSLMAGKLVPTNSLSSNHFEPFLLFAAVLSIILAVVQFHFLRKKAWQAQLTAAVISLATLLALLHPVGMQLYCHRNQDNMVRLALKLKGSPDEVAVYGPFRPSAMSYMGRPIDTISSVDSFVKVDNLVKDGFAWGRTPSGKRQLIMAADKNAADFKKRPDLTFIELTREGDWACYELLNGYAERCKTLEEAFKLYLYTKTPFTVDEGRGPMTVPLGGGDRYWYEHRIKNTNTNTNQ
ncbi:MAG TPA: glycosyltransferase family 39 protein [Candidatus Obscuribacter sp.]|nr:glycosyltransferase family 39 protein [Candidatus Obscuribacter sp.]